MLQINVSLKANEILGLSVMTKGLVMVSIQPFVLVTINFTLVETGAGYCQAESLLMEESAVDVLSPKSQRHPFTFP